MPFTTDPALKSGAVAAALALAVGSIDGLTSLAYDPIGQELSGPTVVVGRPALSRTPLLDAETEQNDDDWRQLWPLTLYVPLNDPETDQATEGVMVGKLVAAIDFDWQLGGEVRQARLTEANPVPYEPPEGRRPTLKTDCTVDVLFLMPRP